MILEQPGQPGQLTAVLRPEQLGVRMWLLNVNYP